MKKVNVIKLDPSKGKVWKATDYVAEEKKLHIFINKKHYATIICSPWNLKELAVGHLLSEGRIESVKEIEEVVLKSQTECHIKLSPKAILRNEVGISSRYSRKNTFARRSAPPHIFRRELAKVKSDLKVKAQLIRDCVSRLNVIAETFKKTGGVHAAALYRADGTILAFAEDVGRHNAVDKVIGKCGLSEAIFSDCFLALSGRLGGDVVLKSARVGIPIVASIAAALDSGIKIAKDTGLTLIGFVRGNRMIVYNAPERIIS